MTDEARPYFPMFVDISHKKVVVVGAGTIAKRRIRTLVDFTECLTVIAPEVNPELLELQAQGKIRILKKQYQREYIYDADLVIAATNDHQTNEDIYSVCKCMGIKLFASRKALSASVMTSEILCVSPVEKTVPILMVRCV